MRATATGAKNQQSTQSCSRKGVDDIDGRGKMAAAVTVAVATILTLVAATTTAVTVAVIVAAITCYCRCCHCPQCRHCCHCCLCCRYYCYHQHRCRCYCHCCCRCCRRCRRCLCFCCSFKLIVVFFSRGCCRHCCHHCHMVGRVPQQVPQKKTSFFSGFTSQCSTVTDHGHKKGIIHSTIIQGSSLAIWQEKIKKFPPPQNKPFNSLTAIRVLAGSKNSCPVGFLL